ncbi:MAG: choice-of-anchor Q domain-containing protein [Wenzhouxiangella sp.]
MNEVSNGKTDPSAVIFRSRPWRARLLGAAALLTVALVASPLAVSATFIVTEATDQALRDAVAEANSVPGLDVIEFAPGVTSIVLAQGQIEITDDLVIAGAPGQEVTISGNNTSRIFAVIDPGEALPGLFLEHLIIENGRTTQPGSAFVDAPFINCSTSTGQGGAICSEASVNLFETIVRNSVTEAVVADGGGIWAADDVLVEFSSVTGNSAGGQASDGDDANGGGIASAFGSVICVDSRIADNQAVDFEAQGGGVFSPLFFAENCVVSGNEAATGGGVFGSRLSIFGSTFAGNVAAFNGGGVLASAEFDSFTGETFGGLQIVNSTISGNQAGERGGGIRWIAPDTLEDVDGDSQPDALIANSTITNNSAGFGAGGLDVLDPFFVSATLSLYRLQLIKHRGGAGTAPPAPGLRADTSFDPRVTSSILSANATAGESDPDVVFIEGSRPGGLAIENSFVGNGALLEIEFLRDNGCSDFAGATTDALLGCVETHRPLSSSPVIDQGGNPLGLDFDQRGGGFARELGLTVDIGAYESEPLAIQFLVAESTSVRRGQPLDLSWLATPIVPAVECSGGGLPGTTWNGDGKGPSGTAVIDSSPLAPGTYQASLTCTLDDQVSEVTETLTVLEPVEAFLTLDRSAVELGEIATLTWSGLPADSATVCNAQSIPALEQWSGPVATSGSLELDSGLLGPGVFELALVCQRDGFSARDQIELAVIDEDLEVSLALSASETVIGDLVQIEWAASPDDEFSSCTGAGLDGTEWNAPQANVGVFELDTAALAPGIFDVEIVCSRPGQAQRASATLTVDPLSLDLAIVPMTAIRGEELAISWTGTEGLSCTGSGLQGTSWPAAGKPASGTELVDTRPLERGEYVVGLACQRRGVEVEVASTVTILPEPADLSVSAELIDMGITGSEFVGFTVSNLSANPGFDLQFSVIAPEGYEVASVFRQAGSCAVTPGEESEVRCNAAAIPDWDCQSSSTGRICRLAELPTGGVAGLVIEYQGTGEATVAASVLAVNAEARTVELPIGN